MFRKIQSFFHDREAKDKLGNRLERAAMWALRVLVFLFPIFVLPFPSLPLESMKAHLVIVFAAVIFLLWSAGALLASKNVLRLHPILYALAAFLGVSVLSASFSQSRATSFLGLGGREMWSILSIFALTIIAAAVGAATRRKQDFGALLWATFLGIAFAGVLELFQLAGRFPYPFSFTHQRIWSALGTAKIFGLISGVGALLTLFYLRLGGKHSNGVKIIAAFAILIDLLVLFRVDFYGAWLLFALGLLLFFFAMAFSSDRNIFLDRYVLLGLFILSVLFTMVGSPWRQNLIPEFQLDPKTSWDVASRSLNGQMLLGTGPGTYEFSYSLFRPVEFNSSPRWNSRFDRPGTDIMVKFATGGILGFLAWGSPFIVLLYFLGQRIYKKKIHDYLPFTAGTVALIFFLTSFAAPSNFILTFYGFLALGLAAAVLGKDIELPQIKSTAAGILKIVFASFAVIVFVLIAKNEATAIYGEIKLAASQNLNRPLKERYLLLEAAAKARGDEPRILRAFSQMALKLSNELAKAPQVEANEVQNLLRLATSAVQRATEVEPNDVENWLALGAVYQNLLPFVTGSSEWVVKAYSEALVREPSNPLPRVEMGKSFLTLGDRMRQEKVEEDLIQHIYRKAEEELIKAIQVKADYAPAHFYLGLIYDREGREDEAILKLEAVERYNPSDAGVAYELGRLYLRRRQMAKAEAEFRRAVSILPGFADARWQLADTVLRQGRPSEAIEQLKEILKYSPGNANVTAAIEAIKEGRTKL